MELVQKYKQTEIGLISSDWKIKSLGECLIKNPDYGINAASVKYNDTLPTYLRITDISESGKYISQNKVSVNHSLSSLYFLDEGDIVFARTGASVGKTYLYKKSDGKLVFAGFLIRTKVNSKILNYQYLYYLTQTKYYWSWVLTNSMRSGQPGINSNEIKLLPIPLPPTLQEQTLIATALSNTDTWITNLEKLLTKKRQIKQGALQELLKPKQDWEVKKLEDVGEIITGSTPSTGLSEYWNGSIPWITPTDIKTNKNIFKSEREITESGLNVIRKLPKDTLLVTCIASIGKNTILRKAGACNQQINAIVPNSNNNVDFLYYLIENSKNYILGKAGITATLMISKKDFSQILFSFPNVKEQTRIATILNDMDIEIEQLETKLQKAKKVKQGMMQELLTGKTRLV